MVIGLDLLQYHPVCTAVMTDSHGMVIVSYCSFSGNYLASGNRTFPLTNRAVRSIVKRLDSTGGFFGNLQEITDEETEDECEDTTLAGHSTCQPTGLPVVLPDLITVRTVEPQPPAAEELPQMSDQDDSVVEPVDH